MERPPQPPAKLSPHTSLGLTIRFAGLGWLVAIDVVGPTLLGLWLDSLWGTTPLLLFIGLGLGTILVPMSVWQYVRMAFATTAATKPAAPNPDPPPSD